jgi:fructose-1,6-bisphosphatase/inositol monophosphatase family enzyme
MDHKFFENAQARLLKVLQTIRPELLAAHGNITFTEKTDNQGPVTELDKKVEELLREELANFDSNIGIRGEELGSEGSDTVFWTIDPIDGTRAFIRGLPYCSNMVSLVVDKQVKYAFIYQFVVDKLYTAEHSKGAFKNGQKIHITERPLDKSWIYTHAGLNTHAKLLTAIAKKVERIATSGNLMWLAEGSYDGYMSSPDGLKGGVWDYAPRALIYSEAGAKISNIANAVYDPGNTTLLAAHPHNFNELHKLILSAIA